MFISLSLCFPSTATVVSAKGPKRMSDVVIGDVLRVVTPEGRVEWSPVCGWAHRDTVNSAMYLRLTTSHRQILVSKEHLVATLPKNGAKIDFIQAQNIRVGDRIVECDTNAQTAQGNAVWGNAVTSVDQVEASGIYAPLTVAGTVVVDGVMASCYAATRSHTLAHAALKPVRSQWKHHPERVEAAHASGKYIPGANRYVDVLAHVARRA